MKGRWFLAVPLVLVNAAAVWGQAGWAYDNITTGALGGWIIAFLFATAVESIGVYLAWESHESLMADQASALLRLGSYAIGLLAGVLNFLHFSGQSAATGIAFGALSAISPWLWATWSRARNRTRLAQLGLVDVRGVKLSTARKVWHPVKSVRVLSWAAWAGVTDPAAAVAGWEGALPEAPEAPEIELEEEEQRPETDLAVVEVGPAERKSRVLALRDLPPKEIAAKVGITDRRVRQILAEVS